MLNAMVDDGDDTQAFHAVEEERVVPAPPPPPSGPPPRQLIQDAWPWLALLGILAVAGLLVWLFVLNTGSDGSKQAVPAVVGLQQQAAIERLNGAGYDVKAILEPARRPRGIVASQTPGGGSQLPKGSSVTIHVSNGNAPPVAVTTTTTATTTTTTTGTTVDSAPSTQIPDVVGQDMQSAAGQVEAAGFVADTSPVENAGGTAGSVVNQDPPGGDQARAGITVTLGVSVPASRPSVQIPDVTGRNAADARAQLLRAKLTVRTAYRAGKAGVVLAQSASGNAPAYTQVTITVGQ